LTVNVSSGRNPSPFLDAIEVPALRELAVKAWDALYENALPHLVAVLDALPPFMATLDSLLGQDSPLRRLSLADISATDSTRRVPLLPMLRDLLSLSLAYCAIDDSILEASTPDSSFPPSSWICPYLSTLDVAKADLSYDLLVKLIRSRAPTNADVAEIVATCIRSVRAGQPEKQEDRDALEEIALSCDGRLEITFVEE
jgi:hypothetical protein